MSMTKGRSVTITCVVGDVPRGQLAHAYREIARQLSMTNECDIAATYSYETRSWSYDLVETERRRYSL